MAKTNANDEFSSPWLHQNLEIFLYSFENECSLIDALLKKSIRIEHNSYDITHEVSVNKYRFPWYHPTAPYQDTSKITH